MCAGYLPASGGLAAMEAALAVGALARGTLDAAHASSSGARSNTAAAAAVPAAAAGPAASPAHAPNCASTDGLNGAAAAGLGPGSAAAAGGGGAAAAPQRPWRRRSGEVQCLEGLYGSRIRQWLHRTHLVLLKGLWHWSKRANGQTCMLAKLQRKPQLHVVLRVWRSFMRICLWKTPPWQLLRAEMV